MSLCPAAMRACAIRTASTPANSSPMKVREEPVTPCTIEMLPARRLESCARNRVGRRPVISCSLRKAPGFSALGRDDHVHMREQLRVALRSGAVERKPRRKGADTLPGLHLALVALFRDLLVELDRRERMHDVGRKGLHLGSRRRLVEALPMRLRSFPEAGDDANAGDPGLPCQGLPCQGLPCQGLPC